MASLQKITRIPAKQVAIWQVIEKRWRGSQDKAKVAEKADACMDAGVRATQDAKAEFTRCK